ncbi:MAG: protein phosphatase [Betaproteobacteria bacterium RBG_16_58_11]|nr:MAG: protein phosphatase [Betaproteobacteria bacterium RBG_16_58_11]OFZ96222.1 MAG: protein phosphatase [Betaproteobacteria bacterium RBG_19FT_COMBO_58_11]
MTSVTDVGQARSHNEDFVAVDADYGLAILADGMGGYSAGEIASGMTVTLLMQGLKERLPEMAPEPQALETLVRELVATVNAAVHETARTRPQCAGMGTTLVLAVFHDNRLLTAHIGDSRLYRLRGGQLTQLTRDHSLLQEQIDNGMISKEEATWSSNKNLVTRALGMDPEVPLDVNVYDAAPNDMYLLCSDGLTGMVTLSDIQAAMELMGGNLPLAAHEMVKLANEQGGRDNISVALVKVLSPFPARRGFWQSLWSRIST